MLLAKKFHKILMCLTLSVFLVAGMISSASALLITPGVSGWSGSVPGNPTAGDVAGIVGSGTLNLLYKQDHDSGSDTGAFASSYQTTFFNTPTDPMDADIAYVGGPSITGSPLYLLVKDGNHDPIWYIFDLFVLGWNGMDTLQLRNFWPGGGAISHVTIYGGGAAPVPEPATVLLLGVGLAGLFGFGRKKFSIN